MKKRITLALAALLIGWLLQTARFYDGLNKGVAWNDVGGIEIVGEPGVFLCGFATDKNGLLPLQELVIKTVPGLLVDC